MIDYGTPLSDFTGVLGDTVDPSQVFTNSDPANCPMTCSWKEQGCANDFVSSDISVDPVSAAISFINPFSATMCYQCTNGAQTLTQDNIQITACPLI